jgi:hypothetical protein
MREKWRTIGWCLLRYSVPAHRSVLVKDFLRENYMTTLDHPPYPIDVTPADFHPSPRLKSTLQGRRFCDATDSIKNATEGMGFHEMVSSLASNTFTVADKRTPLKEI